MIETLEQASESVKHLRQAIKGIEDPKIRSFYTEKVLETAAIYGTSNHAEVVGLYEKKKWDYLNRLNNEK